MEHSFKNWSGDMRIRSQVAIGDLSVCLIDKVLGMFVKSKLSAENFLT